MAQDRPSTSSEGRNRTAPITSGQAGAGPGAPTSAGSGKSRELRGKPFAEQEAMLEPPREVPPVRARRTLQGSAPTWEEVNLGRGPFFARLGVELELGPGPFAPGGGEGASLQALADSAASWLTSAPRAELVRTPLTEAFASVPLGERHATITAALSDGSHPVVRDAVADAAGFTRYQGAVAALPVASRVTEATPSPAEEVVVGRVFGLDVRGKNKLGIARVTGELRLRGFDWAGLDLLRKTLRGGELGPLLPPAVATEARDALAIAAERAEDPAAYQAEAEAVLRRLITGGAQCPTPGLELVLEPPTCSADQVLVEAGEGGRAEALEGGGVRLGGPPEGEGGADHEGVRHALVIDNSMLGQAEQRPTRARTASARLGAEGFEVAAIDRAGPDDVQRELTRAMAGALRGDTLHVVFSGIGERPGSAVGPRSESVRLAAFADLVAAARARGIGIVVELDVPQASVADAQKALDRAGNARVQAILPRVTARPDDSPRVLRLIALADEWRVLQLDPEAGGDWNAERNLAARIVSYEPRWWYDAPNAYEHLLAIIDGYREGDAALEHSDESVVTTSTDERHKAADDNSFTQQLLKNATKTDDREALRNTTGQHKKQGATTSVHRELKRERTHKRALVIGNGLGYVDSGSPALRGAVRDAADMAARWKGKGYTVEHLTDLDGATMARAIQAHWDAAGADHDVAFYYAGHGTEAGLLPVSGPVVPTSAIAAAAGRAKQRGAKVTMLIDACYAGDLASMTHGAMGGRDLLPELRPAPGDAPGALALLEEAKLLRDLHVAEGESGDGVRDALWDKRRTALARFGLKLPHPVTPIALSQVYARIQEMLAAHRGRNARQAWLKSGAVE
jgi:hypothetical protein